MITRRLKLLLLLLAVSLWANAQKKITIEDIFQKGTFSQKKRLWNPLDE